LWWSEFCGGDYVTSAFIKTAIQPSNSRDQEHSSPQHHHHHHHHEKARPSRELPPDIIDRMDDSVPPQLLRHHSGPFDAVTRSAYLSQNKSPLAALAHSNEEALKATPEISIRDSLNKHVPLQNTAIVPPGEHVPGGLPDETLDYKEENLIGDIGRWQGIEYDDDDRRAKGHHGWDGAFMNRGLNEADRARQDAKHHKQKNGDHGNVDEYYANNGMIEMVPRERDIRVDGMHASSIAVEEAEHHKHHGIIDGIKRRISLKRHH
jgi:hypothetical protein